MGEASHLPAEHQMDLPWEHNPCIALMCDEALGGLAFVLLPPPLG